MLTLQDFSPPIGWSLIRLEETYDSLVQKDKVYRLVDVWHHTHAGTVIYEIELEPGGMTYNIGPNDRERWGVIAPPDNESASRLLKEE